MLLRSSLYSRMLFSLGTASSRVAMAISPTLDGLVDLAVHLCSTIGQSLSRIKRIRPAIAGGCRAVVEGKEVPMTHHSC